MGFRGGEKGDKLILSLPSWGKIFKQAPLNLGISEKILASDYADKKILANTTAEQKSYSRDIAWIQMLKAR